MHSRELVFEDGPWKGQKVVAFRHYLRLRLPGCGTYVWDVRRERYVWEPGQDSYGPNNALDKRN
jgi:hypothetical protein